MTQSPPRDPELDSFVQELLDFTCACGSPRYRELVRLAPHVLDQHDERRQVLRELSLTAISDVLNRRRQGPPPWGWVATYVLTCLHFVELAGGIKPDFRGPADLQGWYDRYHAMRARMDQRADGETVPTAAPVEAEPVQAGVPVAVQELAGAPPVTVCGPSAEPPLLADLGRPWDDLPVESAVPSQDISEDALAGWMQDPPGTQPMAYRRYHDLLGWHSVDLLTAAEAGDSDAACRLGILLLCHERPAEATAWLTSAARARDKAAEVLMAAHPSERHHLAAELAYELTLPGYEQDRRPGAFPAAPTGAETYYRAAARAGHSGAILQLGLIDEARGEFWPALLILLWAAELRHPDAKLHIDRVRRLLLEADGEADCDGVS